MLRFLLGAMVALNCAVAAAAQPTINVGTYYLPANTPNQTIQISVTGGDPVSGLNFDVQVGDGGPQLSDYGVPPGTPGPAITAVDLKGVGGNPATIFNGIPDSQTAPQDIPQVWFTSIAISAPGGTVPATGVLANLTIDTTGFSTANQSFALQLSNVLPYASLGGPYATDFAGTAASITNGSIVIAGVPNAAYWQGGIDANWTTDTYTNTGTNWTTDATGAMNTHAPPGANTDVYFTTSNGGAHLNTVLGADFSIKGLTFTSDAVNPVAIGGANTLTIGADGLTMQAGAASPSISAAVTLGTGQTWTIDGANPLTLSGTLSTGANALNKAGGGTLAVTGAPNLGAGGSLQVSGGTAQLNYGSAPTIGAGFAASVTGGGTLELAGSVSQLNNTVNIANSSTATAGLLVSSGAAQTVGTVLGPGNMVVNAGGNLTAYQIRQNSLSIGAGATVTLSPSGSGSVGTPLGPNNTNYSSNVGSLSIAGGMNAWTGTLDIGNNGLVIQYGAPASDPFLTIENMVESGYNGGAWGGKGITSSLAAASVNGMHPLNIGLEDFTPGVGAFASQSSIVFEGQTITTNAVLVRLTYMDDLVLAGDMAQNDATNDALLFAANYGIGTTWSVGDITHDGSINSNDALLFAANYFVGADSSLDGSSGAAFGAAAAVPEPAGIGLAILGALCLSQFAGGFRPRLPYLSRRDRV